VQIFHFIKKILLFLKKKLYIIKYNEYTISEYFRKQGALIGNDCFISITTLAAEPYLVKIGNHVGIASGVRLLTHNLGWSFRDKIPDLQVFGKIVIEDNCNIGVNAIILPNVTIGINSVVAAGSIVVHDIPPNSVAAGVPAKVICTTNEYFERAKKIWEQQKPLGYMPELERGKYYSPIYMDSLRKKTTNSTLLRKHLTSLFWGERGNK